MKYLSQKSFFFTLLLIVAISFMLRLTGISQKQTYSYDESNSFLSVTVNNVTYIQAFKEESPVFNHIVSVKEWFPYLYQIHYPFNLVKLKNENCDNISPLFYWILHIVFVVFGVNIYNGLYLNLFFYLVLLYFFYKLCVLVFDQFSTSILYSFILLGFSYAALQINFEARQHLLFALIIIIFFYYNIRWLLKNEPLGWKQLIFNLVIITLGNLCLITFTFVAFGVGLIYWIHFKFSIRNIAVIKYSIVLLISIILSESIYPFIIKTFISKLTSPTPSGSPPYLIKLKVFTYAFCQYSSYNPIIIYSFLSFLILLFFLYLLKYIKSNWSIHTVLFYVYFFTFYSIAFMFLLYFFDKIPGNAVGEQYYMFIWPFWTITLVSAINYVFKNTKHIILISLSVIFTWSAFVYYKKSWYLQFFVRDKQTFYRYINKSDLIISYETHPSLIGRLVTHILPPDKKILITNYPLSKILDTTHYEKIFLFPTEKMKIPTHPKYQEQHFFIESDYEKCYSEFYYLQKIN
jgi:uncharacterized protein YjeT (DUF2065 family)